MDQTCTCGRFELCRIEDSSCKPFHSPPKKTPKATLYPQICVILVNSVAICSFTSFHEPKDIMCCLPLANKSCWLQHVHTAKFKHGSCNIIRSPSIWLSIVNQNLACQKSPSKIFAARACPQKPSIEKLKAH